MLIKFCFSILVVLTTTVVFSSLFLSESYASEQDSISDLWKQAGQLSSGTSLETEVEVETDGEIESSNVWHDEITKVSPLAYPISN